MKKTLNFYFLLLFQKFEIIKNYFSKAILFSDPYTYFNCFFGLQKGFSIDTSIKCLQLNILGDSFALGSGTVEKRFYLPISLKNVQFEFYSNPTFQMETLTFLKISSSKTINSDKK